jgi:SAM-dependent methyltransferase
MSDAIRRNGETVAAYGRYAESYAENTRAMSDTGRAILEAFLERLPTGASILEIGSGPGWDADFIEANGVHVRRTDAAEGFVALQQARGKNAERLNLITDDLGGPYDGALVLYVLQHLDRGVIDAAIEKLAHCLKVDGVVMLSFVEGTETHTEHGESGAYHVTEWTFRAFSEKLRRAGLHVDWDQPVTDGEGNWGVVIARRTN